MISIGIGGAADVDTPNLPRPVTIIIMISYRMMKLFISSLIVVSKCLRWFIKDVINITIFP